MSDQSWTIVLSSEAERDLAGIARWTSQTFCRDQAKIYGRTLKAAIDALKAGPDIVGCKRREEISPELRTLHVAREGRRGRHFLLPRVGADRRIELLRILHDSMDLRRHLPSRDRDD